MNEEAVKDGYDYFVKTGYKGTLKEYIQLMASNSEAVKDTYTYFQETGYNGSEEDFNVLFGLNQEVKKKDQQPLVSESPIPDGESVATETELPTQAALGVDSSADKETEQAVVTSESFEVVTPEVMSKSEGDAVETLTKLFPPNTGFEFFESGPLKDQLRVKYGGREETFDLDAWTDSGDVQNSNELKKWMRSVTVPKDEYEILPDYVSSSVSEAVADLSSKYGNDFEFSEAATFSSGKGLNAVLVESKKTGEKEYVDFNVDMSFQSKKSQEALKLESFLRQNARGKEDVEKDIEAGAKNLQDVMAYYDNKALQLSKDRKQIEVFKKTLPPEEVNAKIEEYNTKREAFIQESEEGVNTALANLEGFQEEIQSFPETGVYFEGDEPFVAVPAPTMIGQRTLITKGEIGEAFKWFDDKAKKYAFIPELGMFTDQMFYAVGETGVLQNRAIAGGAKVMLQGEDVTPEVVAKMLETEEALSQSEPTKAMVNFQKDFSEGYESGEGFVASFLTAAANNKAGAAQSMATSWTAMLNEYGLAAAGSVSGTGTALGAGVGAAAGSGVASIPLAVAGGAAGFVDSAPYAMSAMGVTMEAGLSFSGGMREEFDRRNNERVKSGLKPLAPTVENYMPLFKDEETRTRIRNKAIARGATIGVVDSLFNFLGVRAARTILNRTGSTALATLGVIPLEVAGEGVGEAAAQIVTEGEIDEVDVAAEMLGGGVTASASVMSAVRNRGVYTVNGEKVSRKKVMKFLETATADEVYMAEVEIANDADASNKLEDKQKEKQIRDGVADLNLTDQEKEAIVKLKLEEIKLSKKSIFNIVNKRKLSNIKKNLEEIVDGRETINEALRNTEDNETVTIDYATDDSIPEFLKDKANYSPDTKKWTVELTGKELREKQKDAIQEPSTETVDVQESTEDSGEVGARDTEGEVTQEGEAEDATTETKIEEEVPSIDATDDVVDGLEQTGTVEEGVKRGVARQIARDGYGSLNDNQKKVYEAFKDEIKDLAALEKESALEDVEGAEAPRQNTKAEKDYIKLQVKKVKRALSKIIPDLEVVLHENSDDFYAATGKRSNGEFQDGKIHIDLSIARASTTVHEAFHAAITNKFGNDKEVARVTLKMVDALKNDISLSKEIKKRIENFEKKYKEHYDKLVEQGELTDEAAEGIRSEEYLAELAGILSETGVYEGLSNKNKTIVKSWINKIARLIGLDIDVLQQASTEVEVVNFFNGLVGALTEGEVIESLDAESVVTRKKVTKTGVKKLIDSTQKTGAGGEKFEVIKAAASAAKMAVEDFVLAVAEGAYEASEEIRNIANEIVESARKLEVKEPTLSRAARRKTGRVIKKLIDNKKFADAIIAELNKISVKDLKAFIEGQLKQIPSVDPELVAAAKQAGITIADLIEQSIRGAIDQSLKLSKQALAALNEIKKRVVLTAAIIMMASSPTNNLPSEIAPQSIIELAKGSHHRVKDVIEILETGDLEAILITAESFIAQSLQEKGYVDSAELESIEIQEKEDTSKKAEAAKKEAAKKAEAVKKAEAAEKAKAEAEAKKAKAEANRLERESHYITDEGAEITIGGGNKTSLGMVVDLSKGNIVVEAVPVSKAKTGNVTAIDSAAGIAGTTRHRFESFSEASKKYNNKEFPVQIVIDAETGVLTTKKTGDVKATDLVIPLRHSVGSMENNIVAVSDLNLTATDGGFIVNDATNATEGTLIPAKITSEGVFPFHLGLTSGGKTAKPTARKNQGFDTKKSKEYRKSRGGMVILMSSDGKTSLMVSGSSSAIFSQLADLQNKFPDKNFYMYRGDTGSFAESYVKKNEKLTVSDLKTKANRGGATKGVMIAVKKDTLSSRSQLIGKNAELAQQARNGLVRAKEMQDDGADPSTIRLATGWEKGVDRKWKYEVEDGNIKTTVFVDLIKELSKKSGYKSGGKADLDVIDVSLTSDERNSVSTNITNLIFHPELFKAYPQLKDIEVIFDLELPAIGSYDDLFNLIRINPTRIKDRYGASRVKDFQIVSGNAPKTDTSNTNELVAIKEEYSESVYSVMLHELQHAIQREEGFAIGGSPSMFNVIPMSSIKDIKLIEKEEGATIFRDLISLLNREASKVWENKNLPSKINLDIFLNPSKEQRASPDFRINQLKDYETFLSQVESFKGSLFEGKIDLKRTPLLINAIVNLQDAVYTKYILDSEGKSSLYKRLAGEAEARIVQQRRSLTEEQRRNTTIARSMKDDVAQEDQLILYETSDHLKPAQTYQGRKKIRELTQIAKKGGLSSRSQLAIADVTGREDVKSGNTATTVRSWDDKEKRIIKLDETTLTVDELFEGFNLNSPLLNIAKVFSQGFKAYSKKKDEVSTTVKLPMPWSNPLLNRRIKKLLKEKELLALKDGKWKKHKGYPASTKGKLQAANSAALKAVTQDIIADIKSMMVANIKELFYSLNPEFVEMSKNWYDGANRIAQASAKKYGISLEQSSAILAVLSPQNDWFNNISGAERVMTVMANNRDMRVTTDRAKEFVSMLSKKKPKPTAVIDEVTRIFKLHGNTSINEMIEYGKKNDLDMTEAIGFVIRVIDQTMYDPTVYEVSPEGMMDIPAKSPIGWNSPSEIANAVSIFLDGSDDNVAQKLGGGNKVRNFYNNIVDPNSPDEYLTADTHAASVALMQPMSANDAGGIGLFGGGNSAMYALVKDAYIEAANDVGLLPRQLQSVTWEAIRTGINDKSRTEVMKASVFELINELKGKELSHEERARRIVLKNPSATPKWAERRGIVAQKEVSRLREIYQAAANQGIGDIPTGRRGSRPEQLRGADSILDRKASDKVSDGITSRSQLSDVNEDGSSIYNIINRARGRGYRDDAIALFLSRQINPITGQGYTKKEIQLAMVLPVAIDQDLPPAFGNLSGGMVEGQQLFNEVMKSLQRSIARSKSPSNAKMREAAHKFLLKNPIYKAQDEQTQAEIRIAFDRALGTTASQQISSEINSLRAALKQRKLGASQLRAIQRSMRLLLKNNTKKSITKAAFIKAISQGLIKGMSPELVSIANNIIAGEGSVTAEIKKLSGEDKVVLDSALKKYNNIQKKYNLQWSTKEVDALIKKINELTKDTVLYEGEEILSQIIEKKSNILINLIEAMLDPNKMQSLVGDRLKGKGVDIDTKNSLAKIRDDIANKDIPTLEKERGELSNLPRTLTESELLQLRDLDIAIRILEVKAMDLSSNSALESLEKITVDIESMILKGRQALKDELRIAHEKYVQQASDAVSDILDEPVNLSDKADVEDVERKIRERSKGSKRKPIDIKYLKRLDRFVLNLRSALSDTMKSIKGTVAKTYALQGLMDAVSYGVGDQFGGRMQELVTDRINKASYIYKQGQMDMQDLVTSNAERIFGKRWKRKMKLNNSNKVFIETIEGEDLAFTQNQLYYYYNLAKDPANRAAFEKMYGKRTDQVLKDIEDALDPEVKEWADWQVNELYPQLYNRYNPIYRNVYRTDMPWNQFYAGRIFRGDVATEVDVLDMNAVSYKQSIAGQSTKARVKNSQPISPMSGDDVLLTYLDDMERFRGYGEIYRDVTKIINNPTVKNAMIAVQGEKMYTLIKTMMDKIATDGVAGSSMKSRFLDAILRKFVRSKIGLNPMVMIKQLTSLITYANDIDFSNWLYYTAKNIPQMRSIFKEIFDNSPYLRHRYRDDIVNQIDAFEKGKFGAAVTVSPIKNLLINISMAPTKLGDRSAILLGGQANYSYYKAQFEKARKKAIKKGDSTFTLRGVKYNTESVTDQDAIDYAIVRFQADTKSTQQSSDIQDRDYFQIKDPLYRALNVFQTTPKQYHRKSIISLRSLLRKLRGKKGKGTALQNIRTLLLYRIFMPVFFEWVSQYFMDDPEEEEKRDLLIAALMGNMNAIFIVGDVFRIAEDFMRDKPWAESGQTTPLSGWAARMAILGNRYKKSKDEQKKLEIQQQLINEVVEMGLGIPATQIERFANNWGEILEKGENADQLMLRLLNASQYNIDKAIAKEEKIARERGDIPDIDIDDSSIIDGGDVMDMSNIPD